MPTLKLRRNIGGVPYLFVPTELGWAVTPLSSPTDNFHRAYTVYVNQDGSPNRCTCAAFVRGRRWCKHCYEVEKILKEKIVPTRKRPKQGKPKHIIPIGAAPAAPPAPPLPRPKPPSPPRPQDPNRPQPSGPRRNLNTARFIYDEDKRTFTAEFSMLPPFERHECILDGKPVPGFFLRSHETGLEIAVGLTYTNKDNEDEVLWWEYRPVAPQQRDSFSVVIFND